MRSAITILALLLGVAVIFGTLKNAQETPAQEDTQAVAEVDASSDTDPAQVAKVEQTTEPQAVPAETSAKPALDQALADDATDKPAQAVAEPTTEASIPGLHAVPVESTADAVIGTDDDGSPFKMRVELSRYGAGVRKITLTDYLETAGKPEHYVIHDKLAAPDARAPADRSKDKLQWYAYAAKSITVNGETVKLEKNEPPIWSASEVVTDNQSTSVTYTAILADSDDQPILKIIRRYELKAGGYDLILHQQLVSLTDRPLTVRWDQNLQGDLFNDSGYLRERRQFITGYFAPWWDTQRVGIYTKDAELLRTKAVDGKEHDLWPPNGLNPQAQLAWIASTNRYFAVVSHPLIDPSMQATPDLPPFEAMFPRIDYQVYVDPYFQKPSADQKVAVLTAGTDSQTLDPGAELDLSFSVFAGPRKPELFATPPFSILHLDETIVYSLGGPCSFFTFQWLAHGLLWLLKLFEGQVLVLGGVGIGVQDWGVSIILLVLLVRLILHPLTKRAQINMMKMGKMMQAIAPDVEKIKKKYKDDQPKINTEMMKLYREKGVNPANVLGCLPMFLQTPIWIALYAMLYYAIELRHEPAFWGFFQSISGGSWQFLADLSQADNFIRLSETGFKLNLYFIHPTFQSINILPLLMGVVFYFQQKITTPPPANDQAAQQQKMMKFMILLFPIFLYSAPAGLTLYILASTAAGIVDSTIVRRHIRRQEEAGELFTPKKPPKPGGFRDRISKALDAKQRELAQKQSQAGKDRKPGGKSGKKR
jgi:YidC/Oxa1 family membrane protein insertase